jgi:hypothetical protein
MILLHPPSLSGAGVAHGLLHVLPKSCKDTLGSTVGCADVAGSVPTLIAGNVGAAAPASPGAQAGAKWHHSCIAPL